MGSPCGGPGAAPRPGKFFEFSKCKFTDFPLKIGSLRKGRKKNKQLEIPKFGHTLLKTLGTMIESKRFGDDFAAKQRNFLQVKFINKILK